MSVPSAKSTELDGALGITPPTTGLMPVICGVCSSGAFDTPAAYARVKDIQADFVSGPAVQAAAYEIENFGRTVMMIRTNADTAGSYGALDESAFTGTATPALDAATEADDDYEAEIVFTVGGTVGTAGIKYKYSLDGGRTYSPVAALGTATSIVIPDSGGVTVDLGAGTVVAGDSLSWLCIPPQWSSANLTTAMAALKSSALAWEYVHVVGELDAAAAAVVATALSDLHASGKHHWGVGNFRKQDSGETDAAYQTAFDTAFGAYSNTDLMVCAGNCELVSPIDGRQYNRPWAFYVAALVASLSEEQDLADIDLGSAPGCAIRDSNGNPKYHDEFNNPGLDDMRACVARTWPSYQGVYVNNPRLISANGSDFVFLQFRRVMNLARTVLDAYMVKRLSKPLQTNPKTGFITEQEALSIESDANAILRQTLLQKPKVSAVKVTLSRNDAILTPPFPLTGKLRMVPLAYPKEITMEVGWNNPAIRGGV